MHLELAQLRLVAHVRNILRMHLSLHLHLAHMRILSDIPISASYPLVMTNSLLFFTWPIESVDLPSKQMVVFQFANCYHPPMVDCPHLLVNNM